jgi:hypothetical protein
MGEIAGELASSLLAAQEGELVGPLAANGSFVLVLVRAKVYPEPDDPDIQRMAVRRLTEQAVARAVAANVEWHERL